MALFGAYCAFQAARPDQDLSFVREVPTAVSQTTLDLSVSTPANWSQWFFNTGKAERVDALGRPFPMPSQSIEKGALVRLEIQPHKGEKRGSFDLLIQVSEYVPGKLLSLSLVSDQSGKITRLFEKLEWKIEILPTLIRGTETVRTRHWRSRMFASLSERILMNQLFYPDLMALGQFTQPQAPNPYPVYGQ